MTARSRGGARWVSLGLLAVGLALVGGGPVGGARLGGLLVVVAIPGAWTGLRGLVGAIAASAVAFALAGWFGASLLAVDVSRQLAAGLGIAVGGGLGAVVWLAAVGDGRDASRETVAVAGDDEDTGPEPRPADLFEASPDPILFYVDSGDGPAVRAVNSAFEDAFGASTDALRGVPLAEAAMLESDGGPLAAAARGGDAYETVATCSTAEGPRQMRVRLASSPASPSGYVVYTPGPTERD